MNWKFWEPKVVGSELNETQLKVLSRFLLNQQTVINSLTEENMKLAAEIQVLRDIVNDLSNINNNTINKALRMNELKRKRRTSPFKK